MFTSALPELAKAECRTGHGGGTRRRLIYESSVRQFSDDLLNTNYTQSSGFTIPTEVDVFQR
jgi:hypothetical protein